MSARTAAGTGFSRHLPPASSSRNSSTCSHMAAAVYGTGKAFCKLLDVHVCEQLWPRGDMFGEWVLRRGSCRVAALQHERASPLLQQPPLLHQRAGTPDEQLLLALQAALARTSLLSALEPQNQPLAQL